jgi:hypothetical protein
MKTSPALPKDKAKDDACIPGNCTRAGREGKRKDIAVAQGVTEGVVSQWITKGKARLRHCLSPSAPPKLRPEHLEQLPNAGTGN